MNKLRLVPTLLLAVSMLAAPRGAHARDLQCSDLHDLFDILLRHHYAIHELTPTVRDHTVEQFIKGLDPSKTTLLEEDVTQLRKQLTEAFSAIEQGQCASLESAYQLLLKRTQENQAFVSKFLGAAYKLDENTELVTNPDLRGYPKTAAEKDDLLGKWVHFQVSGYLISGTKLPEARRLVKRRYELLTKRIKERKPDDHMGAFAEAFAHALDPHTDYMAPDVFEDFKISMQLSLEGIGASLTSEDGYTVIEELIPGGSADKLKVLKPKDKIIAVAQGMSGKPESVMDMDLRDVVKKIRGKKGTKVRLTILRQGQKTEQFQVTIVRDKIDLKEQAAKITYETRKVGDKSYKIGVIDFPSFYGGGDGEGRSCYHDIRDLVEQAKTEKVDGLVIDMSRNGGGLLDQAVKIAGLFIRKGGVVATKSSDGRVEVLEDEDPGVLYNGPLALVTSRLSASAAEIMAGALKDYHRALIVGSDHTFGKGTVQVLAPLPNGLGAMKLTTGMFFLPSGLSTQHLGVASDVQLPSVFNTDDVGENKLDYSLAQQKIDAFVSKEGNAPEPTLHWQPIEPSVVRKLAELSQKRVAENTKFAEIKKDLEEAARNKGVVHLAEVRKKAKEDEKKNGGKKKTKGIGTDVTSGDAATDPAKDKEPSPLVQESTNIVVDLIQAQHS